jgi:hypothetical protein
MYMLKNHLSSEDRLVHEYKSPERAVVGKKNASLEFSLSQRLLGKKAKGLALEQLPLEGQEPANFWLPLNKSHSSLRMATILTWALSMQKLPESHSAQLLQG